MLGFLVALAAGFAATGLDETLGRPTARALAPHIVVEPGEMKLLTFMLTMLIAALVLAVFDYESLIGFMLGGILGWFANRIVAAARTALDKNRAA
ncbi:hypothetical protein OG2516_01746 [Oceanicola granulosus HTCC2516]|uniref:Uncharacterized protein n=1 Tax=Oceanicola granulosus (strain ATCC BAA-861 / DSM 15982 / KCTC 12143 / HTCC2516) TaxID=314256 RepID=Q2CFU0_OCEGH|nr:hypothetical protein [Oceanicola granulosus]EAR51602.1 hypothetical protein OG2516_01746 [Oceanicola granulosus HTCC2516]